MSDQMDECGEIEFAFVHFHSSLIVRCCLPNSSCNDFNPDFILLRWRYYDFLDVERFSLLPGDRCQTVNRFTGGHIATVDGKQT